MVVKCALNLLSASGQTRRQKPTRSKTSFMKAAARVAESTVGRSTRMEKPVRLHIAARKYLEPVKEATSPG